METLPTVSARSGTISSASDQHNAAERRHLRRWGQSLCLPLFKMRLQYVQKGISIELWHSIWSFFAALLHSSHGQCFSCFVETHQSNNIILYITLQCYKHMFAKASFVNLCLLMCFCFSNFGIIISVLCTCLDIIYSDVIICYGWRWRVGFKSDCINKP